MNSALIVNIIKFIYNFVAVTATTILFILFVWIPDKIDDLSVKYMMSSFVEFIEDMHRDAVKRFKDSDS